MNIEKLMRGLKNFTFDEIAFIAEMEEAELQSIMDDFIRQGKLEFEGSVYSYKNIQKTSAPQILEKSEFKSGQKILFTEAAIIFLTSLNLSPSTIKGYKSQIYTNLIPHFGKKYLDEISLRDIKEFIYEKQKKLSPKSISNAVSLLGSMLKQFYEYGMIKQNPYCGIKNSKVINRRQKRILIPSEIEKLLQIAKRCPQLHLMIRLCIKTGMKKSEILALHEEDIKNEKIYITKTFYEGEMLPAKTPRELDLPFDFKISELKNPHLSTITFDNRLRQQFAEITHSIGIYGFRFDDLIQSKEIL